MRASLSDAMISTKVIIFHGDGVRLMDDVVWSLLFHLLINQRSWIMSFTILSSFTLTLLAQKYFDLGVRSAEYSKIFS